MPNFLRLTSTFCYEKTQDIEIKTFSDLLRQLSFKNVIYLSNQIIDLVDLFENPYKLLEIWEGTVHPFV